MQGNAQNKYGDLQGCGKTKEREGEEERKKEREGRKEGLIE
jgi:hypothetical protein